MPAYAYQIIVMGSKDDRLSMLKNSVEDRAAELGIDPDKIVYLDSDDTYNRNFPALGIYFGNRSKIVPDVIERLIQDSIVIAPVVSDITMVSQEIPEELSHINAIPCSNSGDNIARLASLVFETFRLLRKERGIFISYRRKGSQSLANKLYDELDKRGFDVFIDTRSVPPAADFQAELWHRMSDVDTIVLIDTPGFREGRWTKAELAQANLLGIQTLHLLWPGQKEDSKYAFSHFVTLQPSDFKGSSPGRGATITQDAINAICRLAEELRAQAMALRHAHLVDNFCDAARDLAFIPSVQPERWISVALPKGKSLAVVPAVGRPTSDRINTIFDSISEHKAAGAPIWVIYDSRGLHENWVKHLNWLDSHLPIRTLSVAHVPEALKEFSK
ncbi:toll/interleukin-1 receptor domain-containing protein [Aminobacter sp. NyZ550]|uniref:toll/interleukin-1 receptor domain-containing protein n=1 Tax=Aminobacter sp. NyZ550 TaxID=2979870 RepID=UPI0021D5D9B4|nr:toll/interleukin-1 receptor domain-containing protein [Aminobacter sp. NyZ550]WAX93467.1 toll/interleukin-1 receptor domain-containing protein [Aminobacter sp. NyZ550]